MMRYRWKRVAAILFTFAALFALALLGGRLSGVHASGTFGDARLAAAAGPDTNLRVTAVGVVPRARVHVVRARLLRTIDVVGRDFPGMPRRTLLVRLYPTHHGFAYALHRSEDVWPQGLTDNMGNVVDGVLPVGPATPGERHRLAHVYTEWLLDRLTGNARDREPKPAWLYDGLAEWEADRRSPPLTCSLHGRYLLPLTSISSPAQWWRVRGGGLGSLEYCEAKDAAGRAIARIGGWRAVRPELSRRPDWTRFVRFMGASRH